jgi:hypothetical protein
MDATLEEYLRRKQGLPLEMDESEVESADPGDMDRSLSPEPLALQERPRFDSLVDTMGQMRQPVEAEFDRDREAEDRLADLAGREQGMGLREQRGLLRDPMPPAVPRVAAMPAEDTGSGGGYLAALRRAQRMDDLSAAVGRSNAAMQQFAGVMSRGAFQPQPLPPMPSEMSKELQRRQAVADYLKQQREDRTAGVDSAYKTWLMTRQPKTTTAPAKPVLSQEQFDAEHRLKMADMADRIAARNKPRGAGAPKAKDKPRDFVGERTADYERRLREGVPAGWELAPGAQPTQKQREDAAKIVVSKSMVDESVDAIRKLLAQPGAVANPATRELLAQQGQFVQTQLRVLEDLGVPSGPDAKILATLIGDPESIKGAALDTTQKKLDALGKYVGNRVNATTSAYGLRRKVEKPKASTYSGWTAEKAAELEQLKAELGVK